MSPIKGLIFDLDGVLVSTEHNHYIAWKTIANRLGIPFSERENESLKGLSRESSLDMLLELGHLKISDADFKLLLEQKNKAYLTSVAHLSALDRLPGVTQLIEKAKKLGLLLGVGSASRNANLILSKIELTKYMDTVVDGFSVKKTKPDPEVFLLAAKNLGLSPSECLVFEDAESGVKAALDGGFAVIGVGNPALKTKAHSYLQTLEEFNLSAYEVVG